LISKTYLIASLFAIATAVASPFQYTLTAPAIITGTVQASAFTLSFTSPAILLTTTNLVTLGTLTVPGPFNANYPTLVNANLFPASPGSLAISFNGPPGVGTQIGSMLGSVAFDHVGTYSVNWQIVANPNAGDSVTGSFVIADVGSTTPAPEPATLLLTAGGLAIAALARRRSC
jgi:hypothetical protein